MDFTDIASITEPQKSSGTGDRGSIIIQPDSLLAATASLMPGQSNTKNLTMEGDSSAPQISAGQKIESDDKQPTSSANSSSQSKRSSLVMSRALGSSGQNSADKRRSLLFEPVINEPDPSKEVSCLGVYLVLFCSVHYTFFSNFSRLLIKLSSS